MDLDSLLHRIASGESVDPAALLPHLCREGGEERGRANRALAEAYAGIGNFRQAGVFAHRAWVLSDFAEDLLPMFLRIQGECGDFSSIREAYKRVGMKRAAAGDIEGALRYFNSSAFTFGLHQNLDRYEYDFDVLERVEQMARPYRFRRRSPSPPSPRRKIRVAYLTHLLSNPTSVFHRINLSLAQFHDRSRFEIAFFAPEPESAFRDPDTLRLLRERNCEAVTAPGTGSRTERMIWLATRIRRFRPDLLVTNAGLSDLESYFIACTRPAPATVGLVYGPPPQFTAPGFDGSIASARHPLMDSPGDCAFVAVEAVLPDPARVTPRPKRGLDVPEGSPVLLAAGRLVKFQDHRFWRAILAILRSHPRAWFVALGARRDGLPFLDGLLPAELEPRIRFREWEEEYLPTLAAADLVIDTFPSGGGLVLMDAMALGVPVVSFTNDYMRRFDQADWSVGVEFIPIPDLIVERGDFEQFARVVSRLLTDQPHRRRMADLCREEILRTRGDPGRMVRGYEEVYARILEEKARRDAAACRTGQRAGEFAGLLSRLRVSLVPRMIKTLPASYPLLHRGWRYLARARQLLTR